MSRHHLRQHKPKLSEGYISRILSVGRAALKRVQRDGKVALVPYIPDNETKAQKLDKTAKGRPLTLEELARLFLCAEAPHLKLFMTIMATTLCRPDAAFDLGPNQVDSNGGIINLNPEGRRQTKKYRPKVPLTKSLRPHLKGCKTATFVAYRGKRVSEINTAWNTMVAT